MLFASKSSRVTAFGQQYVDEPDRSALIEPAAPGGWNSNGLTYVLGQPHLTDRADELVLYFWGLNQNHNGVTDSNETVILLTPPPHHY